MSTKQSLHINPYERTWIIIGIAMMVGFAIAVTIAGFALGFQVPSPYARVDPQLIKQVGPFASPGLREVSPGKYDLYVLSKTWQFNVGNPKNEITIPTGSEVTFYVTSEDVQHGFKINGTNVNMQILPGQVSVLTHVFKTPGVYDVICTEYCGAAHAQMSAKIIVTP